MFNKKRIVAHQLLLGGKPLEGNDCGSLHLETIFLFIFNQDEQLEKYIKNNVF